MAINFNKLTYGRAMADMTAELSMQLSSNAARELTTEEINAVAGGGGGEGDTTGTGL